MITVIIITKNRSDFLARLLNFYAENGFQYWISIGDSSGPRHAQRTKDVIRKLSGKIKIKYCEYPAELGPSECLQKLSNEVATPYVTYSGDDDFFVPDSLGKCIEFLEKHKEYSGVNGKAAAFSADNDRGVCSVGRYELKSSEADTASRRFKDFMMNYFVAIFSVHRTNVWKRMWRDVSIVPMKLFRNAALTGELMPCSLSVIQGKIKQLDCLYLFRQVHKGRNLLSGIYDWITGPDWFNLYQVFLNSLTEAIVQQDGIALEEAQEVVKQSFWFYLGEGLNETFRRRYRLKLNRNRTRIKSAIKRYFPGLAGIYTETKHRISGKESISLSKLLNPRSPYHKDFMRLYNAFKTN